MKEVMPLARVTAQSKYMRGQCLELTKRSCSGSGLDTQATQTSPCSPPRSL